MRKNDALILSLETRAGLAAARSLGRAGYRLAVASWGRDAPGMKTRYARDRVVLPSPAVGSAANPCTGSSCTTRSAASRKAASNGAG